MGDKIKEYESVIDDLKDQISDLELDNELREQEVKELQDERQLCHDIIFDLIKTMWCQDMFS